MHGHGVLPPNDTSLQAPADAFRCSICLDLVFKPIVQSCGHVFCFWCVHRAMNSKRHSLCPACRRPYMHFPRVCALLHYFLMKTAPEEYSDRAQEIQDMEESDQIFSPRIPDSPRTFWGPRKGGEFRQRSPLSSKSADDLQQNRPWDFTDTKICNQNATMYIGLRTHSAIAHISTDSARKMQVIVESENHSPGVHEDGRCNELAVEDFLCASCNRFLYRPVVLNCGEAFCESCVKKSGSFLICPSCRSAQPGGSVHVCLELHHYLERVFPAQSQQRKEEVLRRSSSALETTNTVEGSRQLTSGRLEEQLAEEEQGRDELCDFVNQGVGCDGCGMFPIVGERYKCKDCWEKIGYDLCGGCHGEGASASGRFNQRHGADHRMEKVMMKMGDNELRVMQISTGEFLDLNLSNGAIQRRRRQQQQQRLLDDMDDYIESFL